MSRSCGHPSNPGELRETRDLRRVRRLTTHTGYDLIGCGRAIIVAPCDMAIGADENETALEGLDWTRVQEIEVRALQATQ